MASEEVTIPSGETQLYGKSVNDLAENLFVDESGNVTGTLKNVTGYTGFSSSEDEQSGHYFPFTLVNTGTNMTFKKNGVISKDNIPFEANNVFRITSNSDTFEVLVDGASVITFKFTDTVLE